MWDKICGGYINQFVYFVVLALDKFQKTLYDVTQ